MFTRVFNVRDKEDNITANCHSIRNIPTKQTKREDRFRTCVSVKKPVSCNSVRFLYNEILVVICVLSFFY